MSVTVPVFVLLLLLIISATVVLAIRFGRSRGDYDMTSGLIGCGVCLLGTIAALGVLLAHALGWL